MNEFSMQLFSDEYFMKKALDEAQCAFSLGEVPVGCVVVSKNQIIAKAHNLSETLQDVTAHAEMQAITAAANQLGGKYLTGCTLYVTLEPCVMCAGAIGWAQVSRLVYGTADEKKGYSILAPAALHPKCEVVANILKEECSGLMKSFFLKKRG